MIDYLQPITDRLVKDPQLNQQLNFDQDHYNKLLKAVKGSFAHVETILEGFALGLTK